MRTEMYGTACLLPAIQDNRSSRARAYSLSYSNSSGGYYSVRQGSSESTTHHGEDALSSSTRISQLTTVMRALFPSLMRLPMVLFPMGKPMTAASAPFTTSKAVVMVGVRGSTAVAIFVSSLTLERVALAASQANSGRRALCCQEDGNVGAPVALGQNHYYDNSSHKEQNREHANRKEKRDNESIPWGPT